MFIYKNCIVYKKAQSIEKLKKFAEDVKNFLKEYNFLHGVNKA